MLVLSNISRTFSRGTLNEVQALDDLSLTIDDGEFVVVIGSNGSGKSTLLNTIAGNVIPDAGTITIDGNDVTQSEAYRRATYVGRVFQNPFSGTAPTMTIAENLRLAALRGKAKRLRTGLDPTTREEYRARLRELDMGLESRSETPVGLLSGGQRQGVTLLMATLNEPKILLLDEHTAALDPASASSVLSITDRIIRNHRLTAMMVTHNLDEASGFGSRLLVMHRGRVLHDIPNEEKKSLRSEDLVRFFHN